MTKLSELLAIVVVLSFVLVVSAYPDINDGLIAFYPLNGNANDLSGNAHHGSVNGAVLTEDRFGNPDGAFRFDGIDDHISIPNSPDFQPGEGDYSVAAWIKIPADGNATKTFWAGTSSPYTTNWVQLSGTLDQTGMMFGLRSGHYSSETFASHPFVKDDQWHLIVGVRENLHTVKLYIDGELKDEVTNTNLGDVQTYQAGTYIYIGRDPNYPTYRFKGDIDEVRVYNRALDEGEIQDLLPTAVFLASFRAYEAGGRVVVEWETASEIGTVGFYLLRLDEKTEKYRRVNKRLLPGLLNAPQGGVYRCVDKKAKPERSYTYKLLEVEVKGKKKIYGPFTVTVGDKGIGDPTGMLAQSARELPVSGFSKKARKLSRVKKSRIESRALAAVSARELASTVSDKIKIATTQSGLYYVDASQIATLMGQTTQTVRRFINRRQLILENQGQQVAWLAAEGNVGIYFCAEAVDSIYSNENIYHLKKGRIGQGLTMGEMEGEGPSPAGGYETFTETIHREEDHFHATALFDDPQADYWFWDYVMAGEAGKTFQISANAVAGAETAGLTVHLQGITDTDTAPDHHVQVSLNGTTIGEGYWDGASDYKLFCEFDNSLLNEGDNTVEVTGLLDTVAEYSIFYVDGFDLTYQRYYEAVEDRTLVRGDGNEVITVAGFSSSEISVFELENPLRPKLIKATTVEEVAGSYSISFTPAAPDTAYLVLTLDASSSPVSMTPDIPSSLKQRRNRADYLLIAPSELKEAAGWLADYRQGQGLYAMVVELEDIYDEFNYGLCNPEAIRDFLSYAYSNWRKAPRYVVLVGEGTFDYKDNLGYGENLVPPLMVATPHGLFASDNRFVDVEGNDGMPEMAIGRLPVVTSEEMDAFIYKIMAYETAGGDWAKQVLMLADNADDGGNFPADSDAVAALLPSEYTAEKIYLSEHAIGEARQLVQDGINGGALLVNYIGHAGLDRFAQEGMLLNTDMGFLANGDRLPVVTAMTCVAGRFSMPGYDCLGELLVLHEGGGAVAGWAPSGLSLNDLAVVLNKALFNAAFVDGEKILGDVVLMALEEYRWSGKAPYMLDIYNLLGDPATEMR